MQKTGHEADQSTADARTVASARLCRSDSNSSPSLGLSLRLSMPFFTLINSVTNSLSRRCRRPAHFLAHRIVGACADKLVDAANTTGPVQSCGATGSCQLLPNGALAAAAHTHYERNRSAIIVKKKTNLYGYAINQGAYRCLHQTSAPWRDQFAAPRCHRD